MDHNKSKIIHRHGSAISLVTVLAILIAFGLACGGKGTPPPADYVGSWTGSDGTTMTIRADGGADYKSSNASVDGGSVTIDDGAKTLKIAFAGLGPSFTIDKAPDGKQMTLSGVVYKKGGSSSSTSTTSNTGSSSDEPKDVPTGQETEKLLNATLADFTTGVKADDFKDFFTNASSAWQDTYDQKATNDLFQPFVEKKDKVLPSLEDALEKTPKLSDGPRIDTEAGYKLLVFTGIYPSKPYTVKIEMKYLWENGRWKTKKFKIDM